MNNNEKNFDILTRKEDDEQESTRNTKTPDESSPWWKLIALGAAVILIVVFIAFRQYFLPTLYIVFGAFVTALFIRLCMDVHKIARSINDKSK